MIITIINSSSSSSSSCSLIKELNVKTQLNTEEWRKKTYINVASIKMRHYVARVSDKTNVSKRF